MEIRTLYITYMGLTEPLLHSQALNYLRFLSQKDISVHILSFEKRQFLKRSDINLVRENLDRAGIKWFFLRYHKRPQFLSKPYDILIGMFFALYITLKERIDIIHARSTFCALMGLIPCLLLRKKLIFDMRGLMAEEYMDAGLWKKNSLIYKFVKRLERYFVRMADELVVLTSKAKCLLVSDNIINKINVIPSCVDLERFNLVQKDDAALRPRYSLKERFVLIYAGALGTWYMLSEMIDFYRELLSLEQNASFFILSQTERQWIVQRIPAELRRDIIIDFAKPDKVPDFLNFANIGIFFIKPCLSKLASCPTKFAEYLACGLPVIINNGIGDTEEIVRENRIGVVVENFTAEEYRKRIIEMRELMKEGETLRKRCRNTAERYFSLASGGSRYSDIYARLKH